MTRPITRARVRSVLYRIKVSLHGRFYYLRMAFRIPSRHRTDTTGKGAPPAEFHAWVDRTRAHRSSDMVDSWRDRPDIPLPAPARIGVVLHVYYPELLPEILEQLASIPVRFDLLVTNACGKTLEIDRGSLPRLAGLVVIEVPNQGRDILPLVSLVNAGLLDPYPVVLKIHTKKSAWRDGHELDGTGSEWRARLLGSLLGSDDNVARILSAFAANPDLGLVTADGSLLGPEYWGDNQATTASLLRRLEMDLPETLSFAAGSMYWIRGFLLQGLRALSFTETDFEEEAGQVNATTAHAVERLVGIVTAEAGLLLVERSALDGAAPGIAGDEWSRYEPGHAVPPRIRAVPFYLPQFHPIPENDRWWGTGFTEWANVVTARPIYHGHDQPKLPGDLGFYDLRVPETVARQAELAEGSGIEAFMYYHYWFGGKQLLERPVWKRLESDTEIPFCLCWANENWTRRWDGRESDVLISQNYEEVPAARFLDDVVPLLKDRRYLRIDGRAIVAIYRPGQIPDLPAVIASWREKARQAGVGELCVLNVDVGPRVPRHHPRSGPGGVRRQPRLPATQRPLELGPPSRTRRPARLRGQYPQLPRNGKRRGGEARSGASIRLLPGRHGGFRQHGPAPGQPRHLDRVQPIHVPAVAVGGRCRRGRPRARTPPRLPQRLERMGGRRRPRAECAVRIHVPAGRPRRDGRLMKPAARSCSRPGERRLSRTGL